MMSGWLNAQTDTIIGCSIEVIEIHDLRHPEQNPALLHQYISGNDRVSTSGNSLADLLSRNSSVFVKQYSPGMLASASFRGTGAAHTALIWNGFNLQSSMNGQTDLSLIPAMLFGSFTLQQGASTAAWGSGAIGGTLYLNQSTENGISFLQENGSFSQRTTALRARFGNEKHVLSIGGFINRAENDFEYRNLAQANHPIMKQTNSALASEGLLMDASLKTGRRHRLKLAAWLQKTDREIPPIMSIPHASAKQKDATARLAATWKIDIKKSEFIFRSAFLSEQIHFVDSMYQIDSDNRSQSFVQEAEWLYHPFENSFFQMGVNNTFSKANSPGFNNETKEMSRQSVFAIWQSNFFKKRLVIRPAIRKEWSYSMNAPLAPSISSRLKLLKWLNFSAQIAKTYRIPTLNDLYWIPGGNPELQPERGTAAEAGISTEKQIKKWFLQTRFDAFRNYINNWILWVPGNSYWTPHNIQSVDSKGLSWHSEVRFETKKIKLQAFSTAQMAYSAPMKSTANSLFVEGRQLMYIPRFTANQSFSAAFKGITIILQGSYTGERYTSTDNHSKLPGFFLLNLSAEKQFSVKEMSTTAYIRINNITQTEYQVIAWRAMPLQSFQMGFSMQFTKP
jgi:iron complex outermembrane receptor protein